ncbi:MAG: Mur ligase family protein [Bacteroidota bacterium]|nr:Mur ligase family protein [Bacteroidota bacterium]
MRSLHEFADAHLRIFDRPKPGDQVRDIYLIGICGTGMGALAGLLRRAGYRVSGSDSGVYPPMSTHLAAMGIKVHDSFDADHLACNPDLVIVGNACTPTHPEAARARELRLPQFSLPEALNHFFLSGKCRLVVAGTHGKTTTTGLLVHLFQQAGHVPGYFVGGLMQGCDRSYDAGTGRHFIIEGDEYDSAYFDKQPKFMHYRPNVAIITSMEFDHADIYASWDEYQRSFQAFARQVDGLLVVCRDVVDPSCFDSPAPILTYGLDARADVTAADVRPGRDGTHFRLVHCERKLGEMHLSMSGRYNLLNALAAAAVALREGLAFEEIAAGLTTFQGMKRRQEVLGCVGDVLVVDDFAHHPTAVRATLQVASERWPDRRLLAVFEPRSNSSRRKVFEAAYGEAFQGAACAYLSSPPFRHNDDLSQFMDISEVVRHIRALGTQAEAYTTTDAILAALLAEAAPGDLILIMSNGGFGGLHGRLLDALSPTPIRQVA